jgi:hypothetical protein
MKIHYRRELFKGYSGLCESVFCAPFEDPKKFKEDKFENDRFSNLINLGSEYLEFVDINDCDYVILPYKWDNYSQITSDIINESKLHGKKIIALHNDDFEPLRRLHEEDGYLFTTTLVKGKRKSNEFSFPAFSGDFFKDDYKFNLNRSFGFCGGITHHLRQDVLSIIYNSKEIKSDLIIRQGFWAPELSKDEARIQFLNNMINNTFIICIRGAGNFSYRLYESMMMGRIPIIIDSDSIFPFDDVIDYNSFSFRIDHREFINIIKILKDISNKLSDNDIMDMQKNSRNIWREYMSPEGWIKNFKKELC